MDIVESIDATGHSSYFEYDAMNRLAKISLRRIDERHGVDEVQETLFFYDYRGLQVREVNALGNEKFSVYDGNGNLIQTTDEDGYITEYEYSPVNLVSAINYADGKAATYLYNGTGELVEMDDWNGETSFTRDLLNRIIIVNDHNDRETLYGYDNVGNTTSIGHPEGGQVDYTYDREYNITEVVDVVEGVYTFKYDANCNVTYKEYPNGEYANYAYDAVDQPIALEEFRLNGNKYFVTTYEWDPNGNMLAELQYNHGQSSFIDPSLTGEAPEEIDPDDTGDSHRGTFVPPPMTVDEDGAVTNPGGNTPPGLQQGNNGNGNGNSGNSGNGNGNNSANGETAQAQKGEHIYVYDELNRLVKSTVLKTLTSFEYDTLGNLAYESTQSGAIDYQYNIMNQLVRMQTGNDTTTYTYDLRGNRVGEQTKNKTRSYVFDATNRMVAGTNTSGDTSYYTYNGLDIRINNTQVAHSGSSYSRDYVIDYNSLENNDIMVFADGEYIQQHVYLESRDGHSERLMQLTDTAPGQNGNGGFERVLYVHEDVQGNTRYYSKDVGQTFAELQYDAYGAPLSPNKLVNNDHGNFVAANYTGHPYDTVIDFYYAEARFYDAANRTWISRDPIKDGLNWYEYAGSNPTTYWDPTGLAISKDIMSYFSMMSCELGSNILLGIENGILASGDSTALSAIIAAILAAVDGPLPFGDIVGLVVGGILSWALYDASQAENYEYSYNIYDVVMAPYYYPGQSPVVPYTEKQYDALMDAMDATVQEILELSSNKRRAISTFAVAMDMRTGEVAVGIKITDEWIGIQKCAEDIAVDLLGGYNENILMTQAYRIKSVTPLIVEPVPVCVNCQAKYSRDSFIGGTTFA